MYNKISERSLINQTQLIESVRWRASLELSLKEVEERQRDTDKDISSIKVDIASLKHSKG
jgi:hypothetical protein